MTTTLRLVPLLAMLTLGASCVSREDEQPVPGAGSSPTHSAMNAAPAAAPGASCAARLVTGDGVGPVRIGVSLDSVRRACRVVHDTTVQPDAGHPPERRVSVLLGGDTAVATVRGGRIVEVLLAGRSFATADSLGVGTTLRRLLGFPQVKGYGAAGGLLVATPARCGLTFGIAGRFNDLPDGRKDSATLGRVPPTAVVDRIRIDGCPHDDDQLAEDDSTFDVQTDSVLLARDLDGNGVHDFVVIENRPFRRSTEIYSYRLAVYLDSVSARRTPAWATGWNMEGGELTLDGVLPLGAHGSLLVVGGNEGDYTSEALLSVRDGTITLEVSHGEDYGNGFLEVRKEGGTLVVDASQANLSLRGEPVRPELTCTGGDAAAVRMSWDDSTRRFMPARPRCAKPPRG